MQPKFDLLARALRPVSEAELMAESQAAVAAARASKSEPLMPGKGAACVDLSFKNEFWAERPAKDCHLKVVHQMVAGQLPSA